MERIVFGSMTFGPRSNQEETAEILDYIHEQGIVEIDTALMYGGGETEVILGNLHAGDRFTIATKANPFKTTPQPVEVGLKPEQLTAQFSHSLASLQMDSVDIFYLHAPDHDVPIEETLECVNTLYNDGKFKRFGLSNYASWEVAQICELCKAKGFVMPSVYQGMYNAVTRQVELELFPCLRFYNIAFYAYNPLAGGLLTGKYKLDEEPADGRFTSATMWGKIYRKRFWKKNLFEMLDQLKDLCDKHNTTPVAAALRWVLHHSQMSAEYGDKMIIGASNMKYCKQNVDACKEGPLPEEIVEVFNVGWAHHQSDCPLYFR